MAAWVAQLDKKVESVLLLRLTRAIDVWMRSFIAAGWTDEEWEYNSALQSGSGAGASTSTARTLSSGPNGKNSLFGSQSTERTQATTPAPDMYLEMFQSVHEIALASQVLSLSPSLCQVLSQF